MKAEATRQNGFVMILLIVFLTMVGMYMMVLTSDANTFVFQANHDYLEACQQNLAASGLVWANKNISNRQIANGVVALDTTAMNISNATLGVKASAGQKGTTQVEISTSCSKARQRLASAKKFTLGGRP